MRNEKTQSKQQEIQNISEVQEQTSQKQAKQDANRKEETLTLANSTVVDRELVNCLKGINYYLYNMVDQLNRINNYLTTKKDVEDFR